VADNLDRLLSDREAYEIMKKATNPYGDGYAAKRIIHVIINKFLH
jgi:UDP-N-acetylglucosamine 2-epimerase